ncbi:MAG: hypothetical protein ACQES5_12080, partial [Thermodesulfobacteriota bacterium]
MKKNFSDRSEKSGKDIAGYRPSAVSVGNKDLSANCLTSYTDEIKLTTIMRSPLTNTDRKRFLRQGAMLGTGLDIEEMDKSELTLKNIDPFEIIDFAQWQNMVDLLCSLASVKSAAITRVHHPQIEAFMVSRNPDNPFYAGLQVELAN